MSIKVFESLLNLTTLLSQSHFIETRNKYEYYGDINAMFRKSHNNKIILKQYKHDSINIIRCWKTKCFYNHILDNDAYDNYIGGVYFIINKKENCIKIINLSINNDYYCKKYDVPMILTEDEFKKLKKSLIDYIKNVAIHNNISKVIIDVHENLLRFNDELFEEGFAITERNVIESPYYIEAEFVWK